MRTRTVLGTALILGLAAVASIRAVERSESTPSLTEILKHFNQSQETVRSLTASFHEQKNLSLLAKPIQSNGTFLYSKPGRIKWEYSDPEPRVFLITEEHFVAYYPAQKRAEEVPLGKLTGRRVFRVFGIGQTAEDLGKFFDISLANENSIEGTYLLVLTPKRQRVRDRLQQVRFWIEAGSYLPRQLEYLESDGDSTVLTFTNIRVNPEIAEARFSIPIPKDVPITNTFSGFTGTTLSQ